MQESTLNTLSDRLNYAMHEAGLSQGQLAKAADMAQPTIWRIASGMAKGTTRIFDLANALGVRPQWLADGSGPMHEPVQEQQGTTEQVSPAEVGKYSIADEVEVPFLRDAEFARGDGSVGDGSFRGEKLKFARKTLSQIGANTDGQGILCFPIRGNSMEPVIPDGSIVAINTADKAIVDGRVYAISEDGWKRIKILYRIGPDAVSVRSYNSKEHPAEDKPLNKIEIIGRVFWYSVLIK